MKHNFLGKTDIQVSEICLGTMMYVSQMPENEAWQQMDRALEAGINFMDTAEVYPVPVNPKYIGRSEEVLGAWMAARKNRSKVVVATKVAGRSETLTYLREGGTRVRRADIMSACEASLKRLGVETIDLYQIHWPDRPVQLWGAIASGYQHNDDSGIPIEEVVEAMGSLQQQGKIRYYGLSNETAWGVMEYVRLAGGNDALRPVSVQNCFHLLNRTFEYDLAEIALREQVGLLSYSPLGQGYLSGKYLDGKVPDGSRVQVAGGLFRNCDAGEDSLRKYVELARELNITPSQLALAFVVSRSFVSSAIFGASNPAQLEEAFGACDVEWTTEIEQSIAEIHRVCPNPCP